MRLSHNLHLPPPQPPTPSAEVLALRTNWKWAYLSHFLFTYNPMLHLEDIQLSELEDDLASGTFQVLPTVIQRLLISLTPHDKRSIVENWQHHLRKQSLRRSPDHNLMGTEDDPVEFSSLIMTDKLHVLQCLCEWQFHNPNNLRTRMKDDDDYANWRIEPLAYDANGNAYWLMGGNRLWMQHAPPRKRPSRSHKRKQPETSTNDRKSIKRRSTAAGPSKPAVAVPTSKPAAVQSSTSRPTRSMRSRQAPASPSAETPRTTGTRVSSRLRGREEEDVWQAIPEEWLKEGSSDDTPARPQLNGKQKGKADATQESPNPLDDVSELTSLSDLSDIQEEGEGDGEASEETDGQDEDKVEESTSTPPDLSASEDAWETVCVTLAEWEAFPRRFEKSTNRGEKAFYKLLTNDLVPMITEVLRVDVRKKHIEEAVVHRKRSSRIAVKESMREAERAEARRKAEEEKEMERHRRWEARARKEEEERLRREALRSARLREKAREGSESMDVDVVGSELENKPQMTNGATPGIPLSTTAPVKSVVNGSKIGTPNRKDDEPWELDCEICHKRGMNLDDGQELMSCERCNKWQHIRCHDQADFIAGRPRRNWEVVDFLCAVCAGRASQPPPYAYPPRRETTLYYNGATLAPTNGAHTYQKAPDQRIAQPVKSVLKPQTASDLTSYHNAQTAYSFPQQSYPTPAGSQYSQLHQSTTMSNINTARSPYTSSPSLAPAPAPYTSTPNMYLSNHAGSYPPRNAHNTVVQHQNQSSPSHYRGNVAIASSHAGSWLQQTQYNQLASWSGPAQDSAPPHPVTNAPPAYERPQQNGYYRSNVVPTNPLVQPHQVASAQQYYSGGPTSQS